MAACTYGIGAAPRKTKQRSEKSLQTTSLCYSIAKSTLKTPLTFSKVEKTKLENFDFVHLLSSSSSSSSSSSITQKLYGVCKYKTYQMIALLMEIIPTCFELFTTYDWRAMA